MSTESENYVMSVYYHLMVAGFTKANEIIIKHKLLLVKLYKNNVPAKEAADILIGKVKSEYNSISFRDYIYRYSAHKKKYK